MNSLTLSTIRKSKYFVLTVASVLAIVLSAAPSNAQQLQQGISVEMPPATNSAPVPEADDENAWIVTVTADGSLYFGIDPVTPESLLDEMKRRPRNRTAKLYIKADARAPFVHLEKVLEAGRVDLFQSAVLLTSQPEASNRGTLVPPRGLEVLIGSAAPAGAVATVVQLHDSGLQPPTLKINNDQISWSALQTTLKQHFQKGDEKAILVKADGQMPFAPVARAIDICRSTGATVALATPEL
jgi:biopolymer transport protein TolR